jgi:HSP20 family protein
MDREDFGQMRNQIHRLMGDFFKDAKPLGYQPDECFHPPMDIYETEDIHVLFEKDLLSISGMRTEYSSSRKTRLHQMEIDYGNFQRTLHIPFPLKTDEIRANYHEGFLIVTVPKKKEPVSMTVEVSIR